MSLQRTANPRPDVAGWVVGHGDRVVELPNPVPADRIVLDSVDEYLRSRDVDPSDFREWVGS